MVGGAGQAAPRVRVRRLRGGVRVHGPRRARGRADEPPPGLVERVEQGRRRPRDPLRRRHHGATTPSSRARSRRSRRRHGRPRPAAGSVLAGRGCAGGAAATAGSSSGRTRRRATTSWGCWCAPTSPWARPSSPCCRACGRSRRARRATTTSTSTRWPRRASGRRTCSGYCDEEVAEHAIALAIDLLRGATLLDRDVRANGGWDVDAAPPRRIGGSTLGIVGFGRIGRCVARRGLGLGMRVEAYDAMVPAAAIELEGVHPRAQLHDLLRSADVVTMHALLNETTRHLLDADAIAAMKPGAYLVNCARAGLVDHDALGDALRCRPAGRLRARRAAGRAARRATSRSSTGRTRSSRPTRRGTRPSPRASPIAAPPPTSAQRCRAASPSTRWRAPPAGSRRARRGRHRRLAVRAANVQRRVGRLSAPAGSGPAGAALGVDRPRLGQMSNDATAQCPTPTPRPRARARPAGPTPTPP